MEPIYVLWVEDDPRVIDAYPYEAEIEGLVLKNFACWDDAREALDKDYNHWNAIILDAKCKQHRDSMDNAVRFLSEALSDLKGLAVHNQRTIPWYILSGGSEDELVDAINDTRLEWDSDWPKKYYSKNTDRETLFKRVKYHASISAFTKIKRQYDKKLFSAIENYFDDTDIEVNMLDLLYPIYFPDNNSGDYNELFYKARLVVETIFWELYHYGILPDSFVDNSTKRKINLTDASFFLIGKHRDFYLEEPIVPPTIGYHIKEIINLAGSYLHYSDNTSLNTKSTRMLINALDNSPYLLRSITFQLCDIILWSANYLQSHQNIEENQNKWKQ